MKKSSINAHGSAGGLALPQKLDGSKVGRSLRLSRLSVQPSVSQQPLKILLPLLLLCLLAAPALAKTGSRPRSPAPKPAPAPAPESPAPAPRTPTLSPDARRLDRAIEQVISRPEYQWRLPRESVEKPAPGRSMLDEFLNALADKIESAFRKLERFIERIFRWIRRQPLDRPAAGYDLAGWQDSVRWLLFLITALVASILALTLYRFWKQRGQSAAPVAAAPLNARPDLRDENLTADQLPDNEWMALARGLIDKGEFRLAVRAMFLACLAHLARVERLSIARHKSNRDYLRELRRRAHDRAAVLEAFAQNMSLLESVWYGTHETSPDLVTAFSDNTRRIFSDSARPAAPAPGGTS